MNQLKAMKLFCRIAEGKSFSQVAKEQGLSRSAVSRIINQLEESLNTRLFNRTTRTLVLTPSGQDYFSESDRLLRAHEALHERISQSHKDASGLLRIGVPGPLSERYLLPDLPDFYKHFPKVKIFLNVSENLSDIYRDELDLVIRMGPLRDSNLGAVSLAPLKFVLAASPHYLHENGTPATPKELQHHNCLCFKGRGRGTRWLLQKEGKFAEVNANGSFSADCGNSLRAMALSGLGILAIPQPLIAQELAEGSLLRVLPDWQSRISRDQDSVISVLYHRNRRQVGRIKCFIDWLKEDQRLIRQIN